MPGDVFDIHNKFELSDGLLPHATLPFEGERFSIAYYCVRDLRAPPCDEYRKLLQGLGFWDMTARPTKPGKARMDLMKVATEKLQEYIDRLTNEATNAANASSDDA